MDNPILKTKTIGDFARAVREVNGEGKTQAQWAKSIGYSQSMVAHVEGHRQQLPLPYLRALRPFLSRNEIRHMQALCYREIDIGLGL
jgi:hypothetical protein